MSEASALESTRRVLTKRLLYDTLLTVSYEDREADKFLGTLTVSELGRVAGDDSLSANLALIGMRLQEAGYSGDERLAELLYPEASANSFGKLGGRFLAESGEES